MGEKAMLYARHAFLAQRHAPMRGVIAHSRDECGSYLTLECGHKEIYAPHFDASKTKEIRCFECGFDVVKSLPQYKAEFTDD